MIDGGTTLADGNVVLTADSQSTFDPISGAAGLGLAAGIGASVNVFMKNDETKAAIVNNARVDALALGAAAEVFSGDTAGGVPQTELLHGVILRDFARRRKSDRRGWRARARFRWRGVGQCRYLGQPHGGVH